MRRCAKICSWMAVCIALAGCQNNLKSRTIYVVPRDTAEALWVTEHMGAAEAAAKANLQIYWNGANGEGDVDQQIVLAERAIRTGSYGLILSPNSPYALNTVVRRALSQRIPVVIVGAAIPLTPSPGLFFVLTDVNKTGQLAAERFEGRRGEVAIVGLDPLSPGSIDRSEAFEAALHNSAPEQRIVGKVLGPLSFGQAEFKTERIIRAHPGITSIFALNVTGARAAVSAVRTTRTEDRIRIVGCDQALDLLFLLRQGKIDGLVIQNTRKMGNDAVAAIVAAHHEKRMPTVTTVEPVLVTKENIDSERVQQMLLMNWRVGQ
ncbi:MAG: substrate-binding domain-containing protein [Bryocella sp.]